MSAHPNADQPRGRPPLRFPRILQGTNSPLHALRGKFDVSEIDATHWRVKCGRCHFGWSLTKGSTAPGNILHLLNHHAGHEPRGRRCVPR